MLTTRPPVATSFREAVERDETMEREFEGFRARAQEALTKAEKQGDPKAIQKAQQNVPLSIVTLTPSKIKTNKSINS